MYRFERRKPRPDSLIGFAIGVLVTGIVVPLLGIPAGRIIQTLVIVAVGGGWYAFRKIV